LKEKVRQPQRWPPSEEVLDEGVGTGQAIRLHKKGKTPWWPKNTGGGESVAGLFGGFVSQ